MTTVTIGYGTAQIIQTANDDDYARDYVFDDDIVYPPYDWMRTTTPKSEMIADSMIYYESVSG